MNHCANRNQSDGNGNLVVDMQYGFIRRPVTLWLTCNMSIISPQALRDGDKVWATVGTGTNQDGHAVSPMTAPSGEQQKELLRSIYNKFQVDSNKLDYIEAHGKVESTTDMYVTYYEDLLI